jgi:hypothetical protein
VCEALGMDKAGLFPMPLTRPKTPCSPIGEFQAPPCTRCLECVRFIERVDSRLDAQGHAAFEVLLDRENLSMHQVETSQTPGPRRRRSAPGVPRGTDGDHAAPVHRSAEPTGGRGGRLPARSPRRNSSSTFSGRPRSMLSNSSIMAAVTLGGALKWP